MSYLKNYICKFEQVNSWHHKLFHFHLSFWIWKVWRGSEKITKNWISRERKELFRWNKKHFSQCLKGYHLVKKQKLDQKLQTQTLKGKRKSLAHILHDIWKKYFSRYILWTDQIYCLIVFTFWDIWQYVCCNCLCSRFLTS